MAPPFSSTFASAAASTNGENAGNRRDNATNEWYGHSSQKSTPHGNLTLYTRAKGYVFTRSGLDLKVFADVVALLILPLLAGPEVA